MDLSGTPHSEKINNEQPNEGICKVDKVEVIKYIIGDSEEFLAICTRECDSWAQTVNGVSSIYHDIFRKKDEGWTVHHTKSFRHSDTERLSRSDEVLKLKNFKKDATLKLSKSTNQERYEHVGPEVTSPQDGKVTRWRKEIVLG
ncbi:hypothetical protein Tco_0078800 [Tanacetum coccineum]